jgi:hypothetical protein
MRTVLLLLIGALIPLGLAGADSRVTDAVPGEGKVDNADGFEIVKPSTVFRPDTPQIVCVYKVEGAGLGTNTKSVWIAEDVCKAAPPNSTLHDFREEPDALFELSSFSLSKPNNGFPVGSYRLEIYFGDKLVKAFKFRIQAP